MTPRPSPVNSSVLVNIAQNHGRSRPQPAALDLGNAEGIELLTEDEVKLCSSLRIMPHAYLAIKDKMMGECQRTNGLRKRQARELIKIDVNKTSRLWDYFAEQRWICGFLDLRWNSIGVRANFVRFRNETGNPPDPAAP